jgi:nitrite reductase/ring-hydroxylating ferredoxin subunit
MIDLVSRMGVFPVLVKDALGTTIAVADACWFKKAPEIKYGKDVDTVEWEIVCSGYTQYTGGSIFAGV